MLGTFSEKMATRKMATKGRKGAPEQPATTENILHNFFQQSENTFYQMGNKMDAFEKNG